MKRVRLIKCSNSGYWYNNRVGEIFEVEDELNYAHSGDIDYILTREFRNNNNISSEHLLTKDCEVIESTDKIEEYMIKKVEYWEFQGEKYSSLEEAKMVQEDFLFNKRLKEISGDPIFQKICMKEIADFLLDNKEFILNNLHR